MSGESAAQRARAELQAGAFRASREAALEGLAQEPENVELLVLAGRAGVELDADDATDQLRRATELAPEEADAWHYLGEALATEGSMDAAGEAFRRAVELNPADQVALSHLGHTSAATGNQQEAVGYLSQAAQSMGRASTASISLVDMYRTLGQHEQALAQARMLAEAEPDDVLAGLDVAELSLEVGELDEALAAFARLRELDDVPGHETYPLHGMIKVELRRESPQRALELAREAAGADTQGRSVGIAAFLDADSDVEEPAHARGGRPRARCLAVRVPAYARRRPPSVRGGPPWLRPPQPRARSQPSGFAVPACSAFVYHKRLRRNLGVCPECNHHFRLRIRERLGQLLDEDSFQELSGDLEILDALSFVDAKPYTERIASAQKKSETKTGALYGTGTIDGLPIVVAAIDFSFIGGSMGGAVGEAITRAAELALETRTPLLVISASGGARMQEGCVSLMQMAKTSQAVARMAEEGVLFISLLTDPTYGGVSASYATLGDVLIAEPDAHIGFAGPSVIEQTIRQKLPEGFQTSSSCSSTACSTWSSRARTCGARSATCWSCTRRPRRRAARTRQSATRGCRRYEGSAPVTDAGQLADRDPWEVVQLARHIDRPRILDLVGFGVRRVPRAPRRPPIRGGPRDHRRARAPGRDDGDGDRPAEGPHHEPSWWSTTSGCPSPRAIARACA